MPHLWQSTSMMHNHHQSTSCAARYRPFSQSLKTNLLPNTTGLGRSGRWRFEDLPAASLKSSTVPPGKPGTSRRCFLTAMAWLSTAFPLSWAHAYLVEEDLTEKVYKLAGQSPSLYMPCLSGCVLEARVNLIDRPTPLQASTLYTR